MNQAIPVARTLRIRDCGFDEFWLRDQIVANPSSLGVCVGVEDLEVLVVERKQSSGGRLDLLLRDPEDDSMYEVELMLGETDESHIIRTIEYWDNEHRRWPEREHRAVLVAESFARRFFNVIQLLSQSIPLIAIQVNLVEAEGHRVLHFSKLLDVYEEPEPPPVSPEPPVDEAYWRQTSPWTLDIARDFLDVAKPELPDATLKFVRSHVAIRAGKSNYNYFRVQMRASDKSTLVVPFSSNTLARAVSALREAGLSYTKVGHHLRVIVTREAVAAHAQTFRKIAALVRELWEL
jgi:hypothetical protein